MTLELEEYVTLDGVAPFSVWLARLRDRAARARIVKRLFRLRAGLLGDWSPVGKGVYEVREDYGPGYRIYFARNGATVLVLLAGGDKHSQEADIKHAQDYWQDWKERTAS
jgi:putative addiction module killer protein